MSPVTSAVSPLNFTVSPLNYSVSPVTYSVSPFTYSVSLVFVGVSPAACGVSLLTRGVSLERCVGYPRSKTNCRLAQTASLFGRSIAALADKNVAVARRGGAATFYVSTLHRIRGRVGLIREAVALIVGQSSLILG